ncbi:MAG TPA: type II secretion system F family protein [Pseudonocardia sp.]|nr:type II secretion system F family protein [Pseudonocardia sp.]
MTARIATVVLLLGVLLGFHGAPAAAQESGSGEVAVDDVTVADGRIRFLVTGLDRGSAPVALTGPVTLRLDGYAVDARADVPQAQPVIAPRTTVLVIDTSGSMTGPLLEQVQIAAGSFLDAAPAEDRIGLVSFADRPVLLVPPTAPRDAVRVAVGGLVAAGSTSLFDAVDLGLGTLGPGPDRQLLVLSDGIDTVSALDLPALLDRQRASGVRVDLVSVGSAAQGGTDPQLVMIAEAGAGQVFRAQSAGDAAQVFREQAVRGSTVLAVDAPLPPGLTTSTVRLQLNLEWVGRPVAVDTTVALAAGTAPAGAIAPGTGESWPWLAAGLAGVFAALALLIVAMVAVPRSVRDKRRVQALVAQYGAGSRRGALLDRGAGGLRRGALQVADRVVAHRGIGERLAVRLDQAAVAWRPGEWLLLCTGIVIGLAIALTLLTGTPLAGLPLAVLIGVLGQRVFLSVRAGRRIAAFGEDLPDALQLVASGLASGYSLPQALDSVVRLGAGPVAVEVGRALALARLGTPVEDALDQAADRIGSVDLKWVVMAIRVQRDVGGNLGEVLRQVAETIRERGWLRRHVKALSAEGKLSGIIIAALPVVVGGYMFLVQPTYVAPLVTEPLGLLLLGGGVCMLAIGMFAMNKLAKVEL